MEMLHTSVAPTPDSRAFQFQKKCYEEVAPDARGWPMLWDKVCRIRWEGFSEAELASIQAPVLIALGDRDFVRLEHAVEAFRLIPAAELAVIPDAGHFALFSEPGRVVPIVKSFLERAGTSIPVANAEAGYRPGETR